MTRSKPLAVARLKQERVREDGKKKEIMIAGETHPSLGNRKVCYIEIPATDINRSSKAIGMDAPEIIARFADPVGSLFSLYQQPQRQAQPGSEDLS
jgi:hypothetical protein